MAIDPDVLLNWRFAPVEQHIHPRDCALYALSLGITADDALDDAQLRYVYERDLAAFPTMAAIIGHPGSWQEDARSGVTHAQVVHGEQGLHLYRSLPVGGRVTAYNRIVDVVDKGAGRGALIYLERELVDNASGEPLALVTTTVFARADGGFGRSGRREQKLRDMPASVADVLFHWKVPLNAALLYRLCGDYNPLHADPVIARSAGFPRPILHGLCTYGIAGRAIVASFCGYAPSGLASLDARFSGPVFPGDTLRVEMWRSAGEVLFRVIAEERKVLVLNFGHAELRS